MPISPKQPLTKRCNADNAAAFLPSVQVFRDVSLRQLAQLVLHPEVAERRRIMGDGGVYHPRELTRQPVSLEAPIPGIGYHIYTSSYNPGAQDLVAELESRSVGRLKVCTNAAKMAECQHFLLYLNKATHDTSLPHTKALYDEIETALALKMHVLLAHEQRPTHGGTVFKSIIDTTPVELRDQLDEDGSYVGKRLYKELAIGICGGAHFATSLHMLLGAINKPPATSSSETFHGGPYTAAQSQTELSTQMSTTCLHGVSSSAQEPVAIVVEPLAAPMPVAAAAPTPAPAAAPTPAPAAAPTPAPAVASAAASVPVTPSCVSATMAAPMHTPADSLRRLGATMASLFVKMGGQDTLGTHDVAPSASVRL